MPATHVEPGAAYDDPYKRENPDYSYESQRLPPGDVLPAADRTVRVLTRVRQPVIAVLDEVLSPDECDALITLARPRLLASPVVDPKTGKLVPHENRKSRNVFLLPSEAEALERLDARAAAIMGTPIENGEPVQVAHYEQGGEFREHVDYFPPALAATPEFVAMGGNRVSTLIIYLNDVEAGGHTVFHSAGFAVTPKRGMGLYFEYSDATGQVDPRSVHSGAPVLRGEKWIVTKWMRQGAFPRAVRTR